MKISKAIYIGLFCPLYLFIIHIIVVYMPYIEPISELVSLAYYFIMLVPAIVLSRFLISTSFKDFFKKLGISFLTSLIVFVLYFVLLTMLESLTGYEESSAVSGFAFVFLLYSYLTYCVIGSVISFVITFFKK